MYACKHIYMCMLVCFYACIYARMDACYGASFHGSTSYSKSPLLWSVLVIPTSKLATK